MINCITNTFFFLWVCAGFASVPQTHSFAHRADMFFVLLFFVADVCVAIQNG